MENNQTDFGSDINKFSNNIKKLIKINNIDINLDLTEYNNIKACETINNWEICLGMLGKINLFKSKELMKIIYCLLTDSCIINNINGNKLDLDLYDVALNRFLRIDVINEHDRNIKLRIFTVCNTLIVIDCKDLKNYKIYELHNINIIKEYYETNKINFDTLVNDIKLEPKLIACISDLEDDYKILSMVNFKKNDELIIKNFEDFLLHATEIEKKIQKEYLKFYKLVKINKKGKKNKIK